MPAPPQRDQGQAAKNASRPTRGSRGDRATAVPLLFLTRRAGNGGQTGGHLHPPRSRAHVPLPSRRAACSRWPPLSVRFWQGTLPVPHEMNFSHQYLTTARVPCQEKGPVSPRSGVHAETGRFNTLPQVLLEAISVLDAVFPPVRPHSCSTPPPAPAASSLRSRPGPW